MINLGIPHWRRRVSGETVFLIAPEGPAAGVISINERVRPVVPLAELCRGRGEVVDGPVHVTSDEGEDGAVVTLRDGAVQHDVGILVGDEFLATVIAVTEQSIHFERTRREVEGVLVRVPMLLGVRRRLFHYPRPPGWHPVARGLEAEYYAPDFPRSRAGLSFQLSTARISDQLMQFAAATGDKHLYAARLECPADAADHRAAFEAILDGAVPLEVGATPTLSALAHWSD